MIVNNNVGSYFDDEKPELDDYLEHYGTIGMKWGVRRTRKQANRAYKVAAKARAGKMAPISNPHVSEEGRKNLIYLDAANAMSIHSAASERLSEKYSEKASKARSKGNISKQKKYEKKSRIASNEAWASSDASDYWASAVSESIKKLNASNTNKYTVVGEKRARDVIIQNRFGKTKIKNLDYEEFNIDSFMNKKALKKKEKELSKHYRKPVKLTQYTK